jgi:hypothetical protein
LGLSHTFFERFTVLLEGSFFPYLEVKTIDTHVVRLTRFYDTMKGGMGGYAGIKLYYTPRHSDKMDFMLGAAWEGLYSQKGSIASGAVGYGEPDDLIISRADQSKIESSIWWFSVGSVFYPEKLWQP